MNAGHYCCKMCPADQEMVRECSPTNDWKCECKQGYFSEDIGCLECCTPCDKCPDGTGSPAGMQCLIKHSLRSGSFRPWVHTSLSNSKTNSNSSLRRTEGVLVEDNSSDLQDTLSADLA
ncbi:tumor necrosis factor receptor superfamily member 11B-like [Cavia porcellus]|uniref:tumor necrosis factor receptor superfamily member 11B-like n=1 Tax=Cavia porcellus TaxID=10141 RepID=UPI000661B26A|nr:tumor necrosis factor receptor superfamily member 11B-like [Cavia porcellus]